MNNWIEISEPRLTANFQAIEQAAGPATTILAVVKANAYGHGAETCAPILVRAGAQWLGVTSSTEGARVRQSLAAESLTADILVMSGFLAEDLPLLGEHALTPVVWTPEHIAALAHLPPTKVHVEVDTGMGRQGVTPGPALDELLAAIASTNLTLDGFFTHFCSSEIASAPITSLQQQRFEQAVAQLQTTALRPTWIHVANTSAVDNPPENPPSPGLWLTGLAQTLNARILARTGLALYGYCLPIESINPTQLPQPHLRPALKPVMTWKARILSVRELTPGDTVGYNATFTADRPMRVALIPAGYAEGLRRELSSNANAPGGWTIIAGRRAPILGRISMNLTVVDISEVPNVRPGDEAILLGDGITADDHARLAKTIPYEILCGIHPGA